MRLSLITDYRTQAVTTDATPVQLLDLPAIVLDTLGEQISIVAEVFAASSDGLSAYWLARVTAKKMEGDIVIQIALIANNKDAGASVWSISVSHVGDQLSVTLTGAAATAIAWTTRVNGFRYIPS